MDLLTNRLKTYALECDRQAQGYLSRAAAIRQERGEADSAELRAERDHKADMLEHEGNKWLLRGEAALLGTLIVPNPTYEPIWHDVHSELLRDALAASCVRQEEDAPPP